MPRLPLARLHDRLSLLMLITILPVLGLVIYLEIRHRNYIAAVAQQNELQLVRVAAASEDNLVEAARQLVMLLAQLPLVRNGELTACQDALAALAGEFPQYSSIALVRPDGETVCSGIPNSLSNNVGDRAYFQEVLQTRQFVAGDYLIGRLTGQAALPVAYPMLDEAGEVEMVVVVSVKLDWLNELASHVRLNEGTVMVIDHSGSVLAHYPEPEIWVGQTLPEAPVTQAILTQREGSVITAGIDGVERLYAFTPLSGASQGGSYLAIGIPGTMVFKEADETLVTSLVGVLLMTFLALLSAWIFSKTAIMRPLHTLLDMTNRLAAGDLRARAKLTSEPGEIGQLARAFDEMAESLEAQVAERIRAERESSRLARRAESLMHITNRLNTQPDLMKVLDVICQETVLALNVDAAAVMLYDEEREGLYFAADQGLPDEFYKQIPLLSGVLHEKYVAQLGHVRVISDAQSVGDLFFSDLYREVNMRTGASVDLLDAEERIIGILHVFTFSRIRYFSEEDISLLQGLAEQTSLAISKARLFEEISSNHKQLRRLAKKLVKVQEKERQRLARDLHDHTGQLLTALHINLALIRDEVPAENESLRKQLSEARNLTQESLEEIRSLSHALRQPVDRVDLDAALKELCDEFAYYTRLTIDYTGAELPELPEEIVLTFYRLLQEGLTNVAKHAQAETVAVQVSCQQDILRLMIQDDGIGMEATARDHEPGRRTGIGLLGMRERLELLGGQLEIISEPGQGTCLIGWCLIGAE